MVRIELIVLTHMVTAQRQRIIVLAGNYRQAAQWARENGISPHDFIYPDREEKIMGLRGLNYVRVGTFWERDDAFRIMDRLIISECKEKQEDNNNGEAK